MKDDRTPEYITWMDEEKKKKLLKGRGWLVSVPWLDIPNTKFRSISKVSTICDDFVIVECRTGI